MREPPALLARAKAYHEAAHAVVSRLFGAEITRVWIDPASGQGGTGVFWPDSAPLEQQIMATQASRACLEAFGIDAPHDNYFLSDTVRVAVLAERLFPEDEAAQDACRRKLDLATAELFWRPDVRAATQALAEILVNLHAIDGSDTMTVIDRHLTGRA